LSNSVKIKWLDLPGAKPSTEQATAVFDFTHEDLYFLGGFGTGKTHAAGVKSVLLSSLNPGLEVGAVAQSLAAAEKDLIPAIRLALDNTTIDGVKLRFVYRAGKKRFEIPAWNGKIVLASAEEPEYLIGSNWAAAVGNEPGLWPEDSYKNYISRVRHPASRCRQKALFGTPEGFNWLYKYTVKKYPDCHLGTNPKVRAIFADTRKAHWLPAGYAADLIDKYPDDLIAEKVGGKFVNVGGGSVYASFDRAVHVRPFMLAPKIGLTLCLDFNIAPAVAVIAQALPHPVLGRVVHFFDEIVIARGSVADVIREVERRFPRDRFPEPIRIIGDAAGRAQHATGYSCYGEVHRVFDESGRAYTNDTPDANPPVSDRVNISNGAFERERVVVHPNCNNLIEDFEQVAYVPGTRHIDKKRDPMRTHLSDAATYVLHREFGRARLSVAPTNAGERKAFPWSTSNSNAPWKEREKSREDEDDDD
jgi:hypothetical protein